MSIEDLYEGRAKWMWVLDTDADGWLVSDWNGGDEQRLDAREYDAKPDLERLLSGHRVPVIRRIGSGKVAQYFLFKRKDGSNVTRGMEEDAA